MVNEHTVDSALVAVEKPHRLVAVSRLDLHACIRTEERFNSDDLAIEIHAWKLDLMACGRSVSTSDTTLVSQASLYWS